MQQQEFFADANPINSIGIKLRAMIIERSPACTGKRWERVNISQIYDDAHNQKNGEPFE